MVHLSALRLRAPALGQVEGITHSLCTLEFEDHRPLYDWVLDSLSFTPRPDQGVCAAEPDLHDMSKRKLLQLVLDGRVHGWDDPRMPTISGLRRRGYTPEAIREFCDRIGVAKKENFIDMALLEHCVREDLNRRAPRVMGVLDPLRVVIENYPEDLVEEMEVGQQSRGRVRGHAAGAVLAGDLHRGRGFPGRPAEEVLPAGARARSTAAQRVLRHVHRCREGRGGDNHRTALHVRSTTRGGDAPDGRKVKATLHWVSAAHAVDAQVRLYDRLFSVENPGVSQPDRDWREFLNPDSLRVLTACKVEPSVAAALPGSRYQFERIGYFCVDPDATPGHPVFNRTVSLKDTWARSKARDSEANRGC